MGAWQASPDAPGLWWRREGSAGPVLWFASPGTSATPEAFRGVSGWVYYDLSPRDGVTWARCVPPTESVGDRFRAAGERAHVADLEREVRRLRAEAEARAEGDAEIAALRARVEALETALGGLVERVAYMGVDIMRWCDVERARSVLGDKR